MDYQQDEYDEPFRIHLNLDNLTEDEAKARFSLIYDQHAQTMKRRETNDYLRPICIDGTDVSNKLNHIIRKNMDLFPVDKSIFNMRAITMALWYFISRGHAAVVFLPTNLRDFAQKCSDPHELSLLAKLELIVFDESTALNPSSAVLLSKTVATWAQNNDGCIVGSRKKYGLLGQRYSELIDRVTNTLISPAFTPDNELEICDLVRLVLAADEVRRNDENSNCMGYQLLASDQVVIMSKLAKMIGKDSMIDLCNRARELNTSTNPNYRNIFNNQKQSTSMGRVYQSPYHFNDPFLPDYVAPPPPIALESVAKPTRIGHRHSIYRVGEDKSTELENGDNRRKAVYRGALIDALQPMFGLEKATALVNGNPDQNEINDLIELGINQ
ncbi:RNase NYN domain-containing protein [Caenorhabditis elegans]|uniref:RNase NYN domain-containing protein n=1 Tax=Caenorhabditis elegans TaxID=6239 RepID=G5EBX7_CAEEL|nr:RNase NYN domain-containing protein [Caenorhabditis elegans]NP_500754.1 RNase NYN domain-containing protein [Caenorhabditis elegans]CCD70690.1 RNase NYN domain-containing protein [Caenorhabditis elegans]CCD70695.1 RNase NYN domain-containing protein [Caenorhabditis elegans]|eukprot:NP_500753.1 Uncharacterized protein CELE_Y59E9AR.2 [Caenorhabditis elegans]